MATKITETELSSSLSDIINRVHGHGESFVIERNGEAVATLAPSEREKPITFRELADKLRDAPWPLEGFADDLEEIQAMPIKIEPPL